jgi:hypothetical protein
MVSVSWSLLGNNCSLVEFDIYCGNRAKTHEYPSLLRFFAHHRSVLRCLINQSIHPSVHQPVNQLVCSFIHSSTCPLLINQSVYQCVHTSHLFFPLSLHRLISQFLHRHIVHTFFPLPFHRLINPSICPPISLSVSEPISASVRPDPRPSVLKPVGRLGYRCGRIRSGVHSTK